MRTQLEETVLEYVGELDRAPTPARAMQRAAARARDREALLTERRTAKRAELAVLSEEKLIDRARKGALSLHLPPSWRAWMIERIAQHESANELTAELLTAELDADEGCGRCERCARAIDPREEDIYEVDDDGRYTCDRCLSDLATEPPPAPGVG